MVFEVYTTSYFEKNAERLERKYRSIRKELMPLIDQLEQGILEGSAVSGFAGKVFKARVKSKEMQKGKSGGYRIIYLVRQKSAQIHLLTVYIKSEKENININEINSIIKNYPQLLN